MAYEITLIIDGKDKKFVRNEEPVLKDITNALKIQRNQMLMYSKDGVPDEKEYDKDEQLLAQFAVDFWHGQFTKQEVIDGATRQAMDIINEGIGAALGVGEDEETESPKPLPSTTSTKRSTKSTASTTCAAKKATN